MNRRKKGAKRRRRTLQTWTIQQAEAAVPYLRSILASLREHYLELRASRLGIRRLVARPGRPDRAALLALRHAEEEADRTSEQATEAARELAELDVFCLDPAEGQALVPFLCEDQLAWYLFDSFDEHKPLRYWRFDNDPAETRRPITPLQKGEPCTVRIG